MNVFHGSVCMRVYHGSVAYVRVWCVLQWAVFHAWGYTECLGFTMLAACCGEQQLVLAAKLTTDVCAL